MTTATTTNLLLDNYTVTGGEPVVRPHATVGEFILVGKRGAFYTTYRPTNSNTVQFMDRSGKFVALAGNKHLPADRVAEFAN